MKYGLSGAGAPAGSNTLKQNYVLGQYTKLKFLGRSDHFQMFFLIGSTGSVLKIEFSGPDRTIIFVTVQE